MADPNSPEADVWAAYLDYFACFQHQDLAATADCFHAPVFRVSAGRTTVLGTAVDVEQWLLAIWSTFAAKNYARALTRSHTLTVLDDTVASLRVQGTRHDRTGAVIERFDVLYTMVRPPDQTAWKIAGFASIKP